MERKIDAFLEEWRDSPTRKSLLLVGCRQTGKTYSLRRFAETRFDTHVYINFEETPEKRLLFEGDLDAASVLERISYEFDVELVPGRSAIVLDEIQSCQGALSSLKSLTIDGRYHVMASGSMLGVTLPEEGDPISPVGYVDMVEMLPMDFEEFLWAMGVDRGLIGQVRECVRGSIPLDEFFLRKLNDLYRRFVAVGGMPEAVSVYAETRDYVRVRRKLTEIRGILERDCERYSGRVSSLRISACLASVPGQLARGNGRFVYHDVEKRRSSGDRYYGPALMWLQRAGIVDICHNLEEPVAPLSVRRRGDSFKVYMCDTGVLMAMMEFDDVSELVLRDPTANNGAVIENAVCCALRSLGYPRMFYSRRDSTLEVDFVVSMGGRVTAIEAKPGRGKRAKALTTLSSTYRGIRTIKLSEANIGVDGNGTEQYPLFAVCFLPPPESGFRPVDEVSGLNEAFAESGTVRKGRGRFFLRQALMGDPHTGHSPIFSLYHFRHPVHW